MNVIIKILLLIFLCNLTCIHSMKQGNSYTTNTRLLLDLPQDILRSIICYTGEKNESPYYIHEKSIFNVLYCLTHVCKKLGQLNIGNELKIICQLSQKDIDENLLYCVKNQKKNDFIFVKTLIAMDANVKHCTSVGKTYLHYISLFTRNNRNYAAQLAQLFIKNGAEVNKIDNLGNTPLHYAVKFGFPQTVKVLLAHKAELNLKNKNNYMPIDLALQFQRDELTEIVKLLIEHGVDITAHYNVWCYVGSIYPPVTLAEWAQVHKNAEIYTLVTGQELPTSWYGNFCVIS
jgi:hypothetical protein